MACPYFRPNRFGAVCAVGGDAVAQGLLCQQGYARGICKVFPVDAQADAVMICAALETPASLIVRFSVERNYLPVSVGEHEHFYNGLDWNPAIADENIRAQMNHYLDGFLQLRQELIECQKNS